MKILFVRFGLPWLIFGSALYALVWNVRFGEHGYVDRSTPAASARTVDVPIANDAPKIVRDVVKPQSVVLATNATVAVSISDSQPANEPLPTLNPPRALPQTHSTDQAAGLQDADPAVRFHTLNDMEAQGIALPAHTWQQMATTDRDPAIRALALTKYAQDSSVDPAMAKAAAQVGLQDIDPAVSAQAAQILEQLDQATRSNDELPAPMPDDGPVE